MRRLFWVALGVTVGAVVATKAAKVAKKFSPSGIADQASGAPGRLASAWQDFAEDVRSAAAEREFELYHTLGVDAVDDER